MNLIYHRTNISTLITPLFKTTDLFSFLFLYIISAYTVKIEHSLLLTHEHFINNPRKEREKKSSSAIVPLP